MKHRPMPRDILMLRKALECREFLRSQMEALFFNGVDSSSCRTRLKFLVDSGYLGYMEQPFIFKDGRKPLIYYPTKEAAKLIARIDGIAIDDILLDKKPLPPDSEYHAHRLGIADCNIAFSKSAQAHEWKLTWLNELHMEQMQDWFEIEDFDFTKKRVCVRPDAHGIIKKGVEEHHFILEYDRGSETELRQIGFKLLKYRYYLLRDKENKLPSIYGKRYGSEDVIVFFVAPTLERAMNMRQVCYDLGGRSEYWFCVLSDLKTHEALYAAIWYKAGSEGEFSLL